MNIEERVNFAILVKYYGNMLTERQRNIIKMYVDNNLSLAEVSEELKISRQAVKDALDTALNSLNNMEEKLQFIARDNKIKEIIDNTTLQQMDIATKLQLITILED